MDDSEPEKWRTSFEDQGTNLEKKMVVSSQLAKTRISAEAREMALVLVMPAIAWGLKTQSRLECYAVWRIAGSIGGVGAKATVRG